MDNEDRRVSDDTLSSAELEELRSILYPQQQAPAPHER